MKGQLWKSGKVLVLALPLAIGWMIYTAQPTPGNFLLGYLFSVFVVSATGLRGDNLRLRNAPRQLYSLAAYTIYMAWEVLISGLNASRIILSPSMPIKPGITAVYTQDSSKNELISAISAHGITITPGELVVDFEESDADGVKMLVHNMNLEPSSQKSLERDQAIRLQRIKAILGHNGDEAEDIKE